MSEEIEVPLEQTLEHAAHESHGGGDHGGSGGGIGWVTWSALLSAVLAVLAAISALQAGAEVNEAMLKQMKSSDQWAYYQSKGIKANITETRAQILEGLGKETPADLKEKIAKYSEEQKEIREKAEVLESESEAHFQKHETFATAVTFCQIAIAVTAIAVLARRRYFLLVSCAFGLIGAVFLVKAFMFGIPHH
jgi:hypothetical protein